MPGPEVIQLFPCPTQLSTRFILLINVKMPTTVGILTSISMINTASERHKASNFFIYRYFSTYEQLKFRAQLSWARKKFYNLRPWTSTFAKSTSLPGPSSHIYSGYVSHMQAVKTQTSVCRCTVSPESSLLTRTQCRHKYEDWGQHLRF